MCNTMGLMQIELENQKVIACKLSLHNSELMSKEATFMKIIDDNKKFREDFN